MADDGEDDEFFEEEYLQGMVNKVCSQQLINADQPVPFQGAKVPLWTSFIAENVLKTLGSNNGGGEAPPKYKFVVTVHVQQNTGAGMVVGGASYGNNATDKKISVKYETSAVQVFVVIYAMSMPPKMEKQ